MIRQKVTLFTNYRDQSGDLLHFAAFDGVPKLSRKVPSPLQLGLFFRAKSMVVVGPEDVSETLILLGFSWARIRMLPVSFRMVPRPMMSSSEWAAK
jgi:hypothetical protein